MRMARLMKYLFITLILLFTLVSCSNDVAGNESRFVLPDVDNSILQVDTVFFTDTILKVDSVFIVDTVVNNEVQWKDEFSKCKTDFDSAVIPGKALFWGNSLLGGYGLFGMSASNASKDYFAHIKNFFDTNGIPFEAEKESGVYENMRSVQEKSDFFSEKIATMINDSTGLVVLQLGDNVDEDQEYIIFKESTDILLDRICSIATNAKVLWVGEWYASDAKQKLIKEETEKFGVTFVDISDLNIPENQSYIGAIVYYPVVEQFTMEYDSYSARGDSLEISFYADDMLYKSTIKVQSYSVNTDMKTISYIGSQFIVPNSAIASHPNDKAFSDIADRILNALGY